ncbi:OmpA family protein [Pontibacter lucknowensis]|uniref:Outer membrane protein OmpA n=1 Tax=Pontibacter lucknowensis TaxID=1077936 RepID=A0A1N6UV56_9BACT|nr:OmpA family protein [Pontibacter lucknowensis]SIQ69421.1 Outer membrane protein OmpA [Pontibacter lucknowensis]
MRKVITFACLIAAASFAACSETDKRVDTAEDVQEIASADTAVMYGDLPGVVEADGAEIISVDESFWSSVDYNAPVVTDRRVQDRDVEVRSNPGYTIYTMEDKVLFDLDKATLRDGAEDKLRSIAESINDMSTRGPIRIVGHTDSTASASYNKQLAEDRANAVKDWLQNNTDINVSRMSIEAVGQQRPIATNETPEGRQKNRRVAIMVATRTDNGQNMQRQ